MSSLQGVPYVKYYLILSELAHSKNPLLDKSNKNRIGYLRVRPIATKHNGQIYCE